MKKATRSTDRVRRHGLWPRQPRSPCDLDVSFWQRENEAHLGQPVRAFPARSIACAPGRSPQAPLRQTWDFRCSRSWQNNLPPTMKSLRTPRCAALRIGRLRAGEVPPSLRASRSALLGATWWWLRRSTAPVEQPTRRRRRLPLQRRAKPPSRCPARWHRAAPRQVSHRQQPPQQRAPRACQPWTNRILSSHAGSRTIFGREGMAQLRINDFARRFVATVDNLGREQAPARLWPVNPAAGRFGTRVATDGL